MNILVTGANGFVGQALCLELEAQGFHVRAAVRCFGVFQELNNYDNVFVGDIGPNTDWEKALIGVDCVVHLAARVHVMAVQAADPLAEFRYVNCDGTINLAEQAALLGVQRFVYLSTVKVNGEETFSKPFSEDDSPCPCDPYGISKAEAEEQLLALVVKETMEVVIIRPPLVYGPGVKANFQKLMRIVAKGIPLPFGAIHNERSLVGLDNLVDLIRRCIGHSAAANQIFLAGDGEDLSTTELLYRLGNALEKPARLLPVPQILLKSGLELIGKGDVAQRLCGSLQVDISKARNLLGWKPPLSMDEGLLQTAQYYLDEIS